MGLDGVRRAAEAAKASGQEMKFTALLHHITPELLRSSFEHLKRDAAPGVDGVHWRDYEQDLTAQLQVLWEAVRSGRYRALPSRRVYIRKADGGQRPLGIAALEDKIVQQALVTVLTPIYEAAFLGFSYGFRPGRGAHDALDALSVGIDTRRVNWILDADIKSFFDTVDHARLMQFVAHRVADRRVLRLIRKWLTAGVVEDGTKTIVRVGTPQGAVISPLLANIYLHYVYDLWVHQWRGRHAQGLVTVVRYADDTVVGFEREADANTFTQALHIRLAQFGLTLHDAKTRLLEFGRHAASRRAQRGEPRPETFDFLGFTHVCGKTRKNGRFQVQRLTAKKRLRASLHAVRAALYQRRHEPLHVLGGWLRRVLQGYLRYHAVPGNLRRLRGYVWDVGRYWLRSLRRRGQRRPMTWARLRTYIAFYFPKVRVLHPYPSIRFASSTRGRSRMR